MQQNPLATRLKETRRSLKNQFRSQKALSAHGSGAADERNVVPLKRREFFGDIVWFSFIGEDVRPAKALDSRFEEFACNNWSTSRRTAFFRRNNEIPRANTRVVSMGR